MTHHYATPPRRIGKHEWRCIVRDSRYGGRCTEYQWRASQDDSWKDSTEWPRYDINNGETLGLPKRLGDLYREHKAAIMAALDNRPIPEQRQMGLTL